MYIFASALIKLPLPDTNNIRGQGRGERNSPYKLVENSENEGGNLEIRKYNKINGPSSCDHGPQSVNDDLLKSALNLGDSGNREKNLKLLL